MVSLSSPYPVKFFKGCLPQILCGPLLNTLSQIKPVIAFKNLHRIFQSNKFNSMDFFRYWALNMGNSGLRKNILFLWEMREFFPNTAIASLSS